jgi:uncharacterized protein
MILEGIVTTLDSTGAVHITPMGPEVDPSIERMVLKPFQTAQTFGNLKSRREGVFHVTDDVLLLAQAAIGAIEPPPHMVPALKVDGRILSDACRAYEFRVVTLDGSSERARIEVEVLRTVHIRDFFGFNRAKHAVVEAAILATRTNFLPLEEIRSEFRRLAVIVSKTGGEPERQAFQLLNEHVEAAAKGGGG